MADDDRSFSAPKGTNDLLPPESWRWQEVTRRAMDSFALAGYAPVETPAFEHTEVFLRGVGEASEVVGKQMYTFKDLGDRSLTLRPEGTAPVVRAVLEHGLDRGALPVKLAYAERDVPAGASTEGPLPPVLPVGYRGDRLRQPAGRRRGRRGRLALPSERGRRASPLTQLDRPPRRIVPAGVSRHPADVVREERRCSSQGGPPSGQHQPAADVRLQGAGDGRGDEVRPGDHRSPMRRVPEALRIGARPAE